MMHAFEGNTNGHRLTTAADSRLLLFSKHRATYSSSLPRSRFLKQLFQSRVATEDFQLQSEWNEKNDVDYYTVLGVAPNADASTIKKAYYGAMRDYHPDVSLDEEATEFCIFLNEVYETLTDPEKRAAYDDIAGFSDDAVNPFFDTTYPNDQVFVDEFTCIGCKNCINVCPKTFGLEDLFGRARVFHQKTDTEELLQEAIDTCPVSCIHWVSAPQLTLLETAMAKIERVSAFIRMMGCGREADVFQEAIHAFEKRQTEMRSRREATKTASWMEDLGFTWNAATPSPERDLKKKAAAAQAASSARRWRDYQRNARDRDTLSLPSPSKDD